MQQTSSATDGEYAAQGKEGNVGKDLQSGAFRIGVDIGGTFTDIVVTRDREPMISKKVSSTPHNYAEAVAEGICTLLTEQALSPGNASDIVHATTVATNAILERKGAHTGLITTRGFRDVLEFRRVRFPELYNLNYRKPMPLVARRDRLEVCERILADGSIRTPLDEASVVAAAEKLKSRGVEAVAICLLHAYLNPLHEKRVEEIVRDILPAQTFICSSYDVLPEIREYERTSTTVVNAYLGPVLSNYISQLREKLAAVGLDSPLYVMQSAGGQMSADAAHKLPAYLVESGPAAGVVAAAQIAKQIGLEQIITLDIGGTTAKTAIVENGEPTRTGEYEVGAGINLSSSLVKGAGYAIKLPFIDVSEIGAGGGSIVWFDDGGLMKVGPMSAGSDPGPVAYNRAGKLATLTDANLVLGYLNPDGLLGGRMEIQRDLARAAIDQQVGARLGLSVADAALGVFTVAVNNMVRAVKSVSTYKGRDPRDFTLVVFGGNGAILATAIAHELQVRKVLVPSHSGVLSASGLLAADTTHEAVKSLYGVVGEIDEQSIRFAFDELGQRAISQLIEQGFEPDQIRIQYLADLRYKGQAFELTVRADEEVLQKPAVLAERFHDEHVRTYGHKSPDGPVELVSLRALARVAGGDLGSPAVSTAEPAAPSYRSVHFAAPYGEISTAIYSDRSSLPAEIIDGPVIIEEYDSTVVVPPDWNVATDAVGNLVLSKCGEVK